MIDLERVRVARVPRELPHRRRQRDDHRLEVRWAGRRQRPLGEPHVAGAVAAEPAVEPRLLRDPVGGGAAVGGLGEVAVRATRAVGAAARLDQVAVAARRELGAHRRRDRLATVRRALEQGGRLVDAHRVVHVGEEDDAVGHLHLHVPFDLDLVAASAHGAECCPAGPASSSGRPLPSPSWISDLQVRTSSSPAARREWASPPRSASRRTAPTWPCWPDDRVRSTRRSSR